MKITKSRLKKIIKEEVIREAVFDYDIQGDEPLSHGKIKLTYESHEVQCHPADADHEWAGKCIDVMKNEYPSEIQLSPQVVTTFNQKVEEGDNDGAVEVVEDFIFDETGQFVAEWVEV